jgi:hypothetical protein
MSLTRQSIAFVFFLCLLSGSFQAQKKNNSSGRHAGNGWRYNLGTGLNFYTTNDKHGVDPKQLLNGTFGIRRELRVTRDFKTYLLFGAEYVFHGVNYRSYYFKPDSVKIYDRKYSYNYALSVNEIHIPIEIKYLLRREDNSLFSPYLLFGYHLRYLGPSSLKVTRGDVLYQTDRPDMRFRTFLFSEKINASLCASLGWQVNHLGEGKKCLFVEANFQYGFSDYYFRSDYSASSMYLNCIQVTFNIGAKF